MTVAELVEAVLEDGEFDATEQQVLRWLSTAQKQMVARSRCYRKTVSLGNLVSGQTSYALPAGIIEILQVTVGGYVYGKARHNDFAEGELGYVWLSGPGGIAARDDNAAGESLLRLFPAPKAGALPEPGAEISLYAVMQAPALLVADNTTLKIPEDYVDALVSGALATGFLRVESRPDLAAPHAQIFAAGCTELLKATNRKFRGTGPAMVRVIGINA